MSNKIEKHYIDFTEELLYNYKNIEIYIQNLEEMLNDLNNGIFIQGINYDNIKVSPTYKIQNLIMNNAIDIAEAKKEIEIKIYTEKRLKKALDKTINNLPHLSQEIIRLKYLDKMSWDSVVDKLYCGVTTAIEYRNNAIKSIAVGLFGMKICRNDNPTLFDALEI